MEDRFAIGQRLTSAILAGWRLVISSLAVALAALLLGVGLSACGGSGGRSAKTEQGATAAANTATKASSQASQAGGGPSESGGIGPSKDSTPAPSRASGEASSSSTVGPDAMPTGDQDGDSSDKSAFDKDDSFITTFGHSAGAADRRAITALVKRYYAAIAKADGATACKLLFFVITESAAETYGQTAFDAAAGRGKSCGPVMSKVFARNRQQLITENRLLEVMAIRIQRKRAWVLLRFGPQSVRRMVAYREGHSWKIGELLDTELV